MTLLKKVSIERKMTLFEVYYKLPRLRDNLFKGELYKGFPEEDIPEARR
jgi:hypothetical protein